MTSTLATILFFDSTSYIPFLPRFGLHGLHICPSVSVLVSPRYIVGTPGFCTDSWVPHTCLDSKIHRSWIVHSEGLPIFFSICFLAFSFLSLVPHVSFVPATFLGSDIHVTVFLLLTFSSSSPFMGSYFYVLGAPLFYFISHVPFFTRYSAAG